MSEFSSDKIKNQSSAFLPFKKSAKKQYALATVRSLIKEIDPLSLITGLAFLTLSVLTLVMSMFGFIRYFWLAAFISMFASVCTMLSLFYLYERIKQRKNKRNLIREAINRCVHFRN